jgi:hypothetical protein
VNALARVLIIGATILAYELKKAKEAHSKMDEHIEAAVGAMKVLKVHLKNPSYW